jgi:LysM repeat protein
MSHRRRRISRVLLSVLALTIAVGVFTYARRSGPTQANDVASAGQPQPSPAPSPAPPDQHPQTQPQSQPSQPELASALPGVIGDAVIEPVKQSAPQTPPAPLRTETPGRLVTQTPGAGSTGSNVGAAQPQQQAAAPKPTAVPSNTAGKAAGTNGATVTDPAKVTIKPYQPPAGGHTSATGAEAIADGRAKMQAGKLLEARDTVNAALVSGKLSGYDADAARALLSEINQTVVFSNRKFADDRFGGTYQVQSGDRLDKIGARYVVTSDMLMRVNGLSDPRRLRSGAYIKVIKGPFHAVVSKSAFRLDLYLGGLPGSGSDVAYVTSFPVGLGKDDSTPLGKWQVEPDRKVKNPVYYSPRGEGVIAADDPKIPLGEYWLALEGTEGDALNKQSYGIHGTIDPDSIGTMASMGCIRLKNEDIERVYELLIDGKSTVAVTE